MSLKDILDANGFHLLRGVLTEEQASALTHDLQGALTSPAFSDSLIQQDGVITGARNLIRLWPPVRDLVRELLLRSALSSILRGEWGLVRALYFDKPPGRSWALPWHKDMTIAVRNNQIPSELFRKPTTKAGVPHVEAPLWLLERMLTARIHLDDTDKSNGALHVLPGSHQTGKVLDLGVGEPMQVRARAGDVLLMRPLLAHASGGCEEGCPRHRRILHLEFACDRDLPDGYEWDEYERHTA